MKNPRRHYARETFETVEEHNIYSGVYRTAWQAEALARMDFTALLKPHAWGGAHYRTHWKKALILNGFAIPAMPKTRCDYHPVTTRGGARQQAVRMILILAMDPQHPTAPSAFDEAFHFARGDESPWEVMRNVSRVARNRAKEKGGIGRKEFDSRVRKGLARTATGRYYTGPPKRKRRTLR